MQAENHFFNFSRILGVAILLIFSAPIHTAHTEKPAHTTRATNDALNPDEVLLRDGSVMHGFIVSANAKSITLQTEDGEKKISRKEIIRIRENDELESLYTQVPKADTLPDWRVIISDIRLEDSIRKLEQIPATIITEGVFRNVPYRSFRINDFYELNIYGDPASPAGMELGIYGIRRNIPVLQKKCRDFLASYLTRVDQLNAIYGISPKGESRKIGSMIIETTPPSGIDADGAWWISIYNEDTIRKSRLSDEDYEKLSLPKKLVMTLNGRVNPVSWAKDQLSEIRRRTSGDRVLVRGFKKDRHGRFHLISE